MSADEPFTPTQMFNTVSSDLRDAVNAACTCGGGGPDDGCPACKVWHRMQNAMRRARIFYGAEPHFMERK